ncbi:MAG: hypothetical protein J6A77_14120 [Lachnospiraceae bacterium]|nr:hypothetical protein [Lachnospiraceae bacterium]
MKAGQNTRWRASINEKLQKENMGEQLAAIGGAVLFDVVCALIFLCAALFMLEEAYPKLEISLLLMLQALVTAVIVSGLMELAERLKRLPAAGVRAGLLLCGVVWVTLNLWKMKRAKELWSGFQSLAKSYMTDWNSYYGMSVHVPAGNAADMEKAVTFGLVTLLFFLLLAAKRWKKNGVTAVLPLLVLLSQLLVGESPQGKGLFFLFVGILFANSRSFNQPDFQVSSGKGGSLLRREQFFVWGPSLAGIVLLCGAVFLFGRGRAEENVKEYAGKTQELLETTVEEVAGWEIWQKIEDPGGVEEIISQWMSDMSADTETLDNEEPEFKNTPFFWMSAEEKPSGILYLKGFSAGAYDGGVWERRTEEFWKACRTAGYDPEQLSEQLAFLGAEKLKERYGVKKLEDHSRGMEAGLFYYEPATQKAYLPYFSEADLSEIAAEGEGDYSKKKKEEQLDFSMWQYSGSYASYLDYFEQLDKEDWESWYEEYVQENYLTVPGYMSNVKAVSEMVRKMEYRGTDFTEVDTVNEERLVAAYLVADWLGRNTTYSKKLPELPKGADPVEYFLGTTKQGYCMHYASAAVMILRELGVPARYASGYVVNGSMFAKSGNSYRAVILDNRAHAWPEVYLEGIGWVPVEVTKGYSTLLPTPTPLPTSTPVPTAADTPTPVPTMEAGKTPTPVPEAGETPVPTKSEAKPTEGVVKETPTPTPNLLPGITYVPLPAVTDAPGITKAPDEGGNPDILLEKEPRPWYEVLGLTAAGILLFVLVMHYIVLPMFKVNKFFQLEKVYHRRLLRVMKKGGNGWAIKMINQSVYRQLLFNGKVKRGLRDPEYGEALKKQYTEVEPEDWDRYMVIVTEAEFSKREFTEEEVEFCYKIYRDAVYGK